MYSLQIAGESSSSSSSLSENCQSDDIRHLLEQALCIVEANDDDLHLPADNTACAATRVYLLDSNEQLLHEWHKRPFTIDRITYQSVGEYVLYHLVLKLGWKFSWFTNAPLDSIKLILNASSPDECINLATHLIDLFSKQTNTHVHLSNLAAEMEPLLHKAYRNKIAAWPDISVALMETENLLIVRCSSHDTGATDSLFDPIFTSGCSKQVVNDAVSSAGTKSLLHHLAASMSSIQDDSHFLARNLVGMVLMEMRLYYGGTTLEDFLCKAELPFAGFSSYCKFKPFCSETPQQSQDRLELDVDRISGYYLVPPDHPFSPTVGALFTKQWHQYFSVVEYCLYDLLHRLGIYDGPLEINNILFKAKLGDPIDLLDFAQSLIDRWKSKDSKISVIIDDWKQNQLSLLLISCLNAKIESSESFADQLLKSYPQLLLCTSWDNSGSDQFELDCGLDSNHWHMFRKHGFSEKDILRHMMASNIQRKSSDESMEYLNQLHKNACGLALMQVRQRLWDAKLHAKEEQERLIEQQSQDAVKSELLRLCGGGATVRSVTPDSSAKAGDTADSSKASTVVVDRKTRKIVITKKPVPPDVSVACEKQPTDIPAGHGSINGFSCAPTVAVDKAQRKITIQKKPLQVPVIAAPVVKAAESSPVTSVAEVPARYDTPTSTDSAASPHDAAVALQTPPPAGAETISTSVKRNISVLERLKTMNFDKKKTSDEANALKVLESVEKKMSHSRTHSLKTKHTEDDDFGTGSSKRAKAGDDEVPLPPLPIAREKLQTLNIDRSDIDRLDEAELRIVGQHFQQQQRQLLETTAVQRQEIRTLRQRVKIERSKPPLIVVSNSFDLPWNQPQPPTFPFGPPTDGAAYEQHPSNLRSLFDV